MTASSRMIWNTEINEIHDTRDDTNVETGDMSALKILHADHRYYNFVRKNGSQSRKISNN